MDAEDALLQQWNEGDAQAGARLALLDVDWIRGRIRRARGEALLGEAETEDQIQDLLVEMLAYRPRFAVRSRGQFRALVARMLENDLVDRARRSNRRPNRTHKELGETRLDLTGRQITAPGDAAQRSEDIAWLRVGVEFLEDERRQLIIQHVFDGKSFDELALGDEAARNALRMRYNRAMVKLGGIIRQLRTGQIDGLLEGRSAD